MTVFFQRFMIGVAIVALTAMSADLRAQNTRTVASMDTLFADVIAKEAAVRRALSSRSSASSVLKAVRTVVADYERLVSRYPSSGFCDDALWRAASLSSDAFDKFHDPQEQTVAMRLLQTLSSQYSASKFAKQAPAQLAALKALRPGAPVRTEPVAPVAPPSGKVEPVTPPPAPVAGKIAPVTPPAAPVAGKIEPIAPPAAPATAKIEPVTLPVSPSSGKIATIKAIRRAAMNDVVRIVIELDMEVRFHDERLDNPARVFVDLPSTRAAAPLKDQTIRFDSDADLVRQVRIGRHPNDTTRVVLDIAGVSSYSVYPLYSPYRLVIDCLRATPVAALDPTPPFPLPAKPAPLPSLSARRLEAWTRDLPVMTPMASAALTEAMTDVTSNLPASPVIASRVTAPSLPQGSPSRNLAGGFSIARQLGLGVSKIVIDPGHGGHDPGAKGGGTTEAELVLDVSLKLEKLLQTIPDVEVVLTRRGDDYVPLQERTAIANRESADLFLSIHANANSSSQVQGIETYFLNFATNLSAAAVAARENAASGQSMGELPDVVKTIALNNKLDESRDFATFVQREMMAKLRPANKGLKDLGVKQAPFVVLIGAAMPSVLAEVSFMTNAQEAKLLKVTSYRQRIAEALFEAIRTYQTSLKKLPAVARQSQP